MIFPVRSIIKHKGNKWNEYRVTANYLSSGKGSTRLTNLPEAKIKDGFYDHNDDNWYLVKSPKPQKRKKR